MDINSIKKRVLTKYKPSLSDNRKLFKLSNDLIKELWRNNSQNQLPRFPVSDIVLGGSVAKGTWLKESADIDIFIKLNANSNRKDLVNSLEIGKNTLDSLDYPWSLCYSEHPYIEAKTEFLRRKIKINIVSCFDVVNPKDKKSAADRSPHHTKYILGKFNSKLKDEVRILKQFLISNKIYGAEIKTQGFSGYVCELLVLRYGNFQNVLKHMSNFTPGITPGNSIYFDESHYKFTKLHNSPIIMLDPVDPERNLGTAISSQNLNKFIYLSTKFLDNPSNNFFNQSRIKFNESLSDNLLLVYFKHDKKTIDTLWGQLRRSFNHTSKYISKNGFNILRSTISSNDKDQSAFIFLLENISISNTRFHLGPFSHMKNESIAFIKKNKRQSLSFWIDSNGQLNSLQPRQNPKIKDLLITSINSNNMLGIAPGIKNSFNSTCKLYTGKSVISTSKNKSWLNESLGDVIGTESQLS